LARFADTAGIDKVVAKMEELAQRHGPRFAPAPLLRRLAEAHRMLSEFKELDRTAAAAEAAQPMHHPAGA
jgi:hypothetical protein